MPKKKKTHKVSKIEKFRIGVKALMRTIKYIYQENGWSVALRDILFVVRTGLDIYFIMLGGQFIDATAEILLNWEVFTPKEYFFTGSFRYLALSLAVWILSQLINNIRAALRERLNNAVMVRANHDLLNKIGSENLQEVEQPLFQGLVTFVPNYSVDKLFLIYDLFSDVIRHIITAVGAMYIVYNTMGYSVVFLLLIALPEPIVHYIGDRRIRNFRREEIFGIKYVNYLLNLALDIPAFSELKVNGIFKYLRKNYLKGDLAFINGLNKLYVKLFSTNSFYAMLGQVLRYLYVIYMLSVAVAQRISIGHFKALFDYAATTYNSSYWVARNTFLVYDNLSYASEFFRFIDYEGFGDIKHGETKLSKKTPEIQLLNLDFEYPDDNKKVLHDLNLTVKPGDKIAFVGGDGSGKSSLIKALCGLYELRSGDYTLDGNSIRELSRGELKRHLSVVYQNFVRYNFSLKQNIVISGNRDNLNKSLYERVKKVAQVDKFMEKEGLKDDDILGKFFPGGKEISPGYWQRLAIARMLYRNASIFIMDEPFTFIDGSSRNDILKSIIEFLGVEKTLIYITQDTDQLRLFDKIYYIFDGRIVESGTYTELIKNKGKFYKEFRLNQ